MSSSNVHDLQKVFEDGVNVITTGGYEFQGRIVNSSKPSELILDQFDSLGLIKLFVRHVIGIQPFDEFE